MAKENNVILHGQLIAPPRIYGTNDGELTKAVFYIKVMRRPIMINDIMPNKLYFDCPVILTRNENLIKNVSKLHVNDMVDIKGVLSTREVIKKTVCPYCGAENKKEGNTVYITPIYICGRESLETPEDGLALLKERAEVSNQIMVIGRLCNDPQKYIDEKGRSYAQYQMKISRKYRIKEDPPHIKKDYPWVKTFGAQALKDSEGLMADSMVYINGALQTREITRTIECETCYASYEFNETVTEIVPYSTEYLDKCIWPEGAEDDEDIRTEEIGETE